MALVPLFLKAWGGGRENEDGMGIRRGVKTQSIWLGESGRLYVRKHCNWSCRLRLTGRGWVLVLALVGDGRAKIWRGV